MWIILIWKRMKNLMRTKAIENAKARALALTKPLQQEVGPAIYISDNEVYPIHPMMQKESRLFVAGATGGCPITGITKN